jgi:predicted DNA-binding transcriptional regulator AlpA
MNSDRSMKAEDILTPQQLAERLQVGVSWVYEKSRRRGEHTEKPLPVLHCGRYLRFYWPDVCEWMRSGTNERAATQRKTT